MAPKVLILAGDFTEDYEIMVPYQTLVMLGYEVHVACPGKAADGKIKTAVHDFVGDQTYIELPGHLFQLNYDFEAIKTEDYVGLFLPGGRGPEYIRLTPRVLDIVKEFDAEKKPIAAVCHGVQVLTAARVITGQKISAYYACQHEVELAGAEFANIKVDDAITSGHFVSAPAWPAHPALMRKFVEMLGAKIQIE